ncbi:MAG: MFS transporter [Dehalococcoidales bacterium]|nr:MFS transporter [Dehalococcoidales bacterium]
MNQNSTPVSSPGEINPESRRKETDPVLKDVGMVASFKIPNFRYLLTGTVLSNAAQFIQQVTLNWLVYDMTGSGAILGYLNTVRSVATLGIVPVSGLLIDRLDRRRLLLGVNTWLFAITFVLGILLLLGHSEIIYLFVFTFMCGLAQTIDHALRQVLVFNIVPRAVTPNALAIIQTGWGLMRTLGPALGGFLILWFGPGGNFLIQAGAYALVMFSVLRIQFLHNKTNDMQSSPFHNIKEGFRYVAANKRTRTFMLMGLMLPVFIIPVFTILSPIYAADVFEGGADTLGLLMAFTGIGGIFGGVCTAALNRVERRGLVQLSALFLLGISIIGFAFSPVLWTALVMLAFIGFFEMIFMVTNQTLLQLSIPDEIRGRVTSIVNLNAALMPVGCLIAGFGSDMMAGPQNITIVLGGIASIVAAGVFLSSPLVRNYRMSQAISQHA